MYMSLTYRFLDTYVCTGMDVDPSISHFETDRADGISDVSSESEKEEKEVPEHVNSQTSFYGYFTTIMQDRIQHQAGVIARAPNRDHYMTSLKYLEHLMDQGDELLALRDETSDSVKSQGQYKNGVVPRGDGSSKRNRYRRNLNRYGRAHV